MGPTLTFRPTSARVYAAMCWVVAAAMLLAFASNGGLAEVLQYGPVALALAALGWAVFWNPFVRVEPRGVTLANVFRTHEVGWDAVERVETRWGLSLWTPAGKLSGWGAPARGGLFAGRRRPDEQSELFDTDGTGTFSASGDSVLVGRVIELRAATGAGPGRPAGAWSGVRTWTNVPAVVAVLGGLSLAVVAATTLG
ncbi:PH (Pleckstrin Homology) domain-containing protein [Georgenia soli]|uniref:PH (Pleckstrin Homology) domain-containing protein n=1 Tax=Georgenia soli TaxID=638953 RepID=A0A2A9EIN6_9MICO|nr:PH domain-containing protein [Georgenia soli]PFG38758.1 PH (Pleckstrin Homology) domain-containing protein [Georgenia soli]